MLSKRLREVAKFIDKGKVVYDVGSDHALLPCFLVQEKICDRVYACDNKQGPLNKAIENIRRFQLEDEIIPVLANGIDKISQDVNIITICGMGFYTVKTILENKEKLEIAYEMKYDINIAYSKIADEITLTANGAQWKLQEETIASNSYFKELCINTQNFKDILGEQGYISILSNNKEIAKIISNQEENIKVNIETNKLKEITLKTSKPQKEGILEKL